MARKSAVSRALILARVTGRLSDELAWLNQVASEVQRAGWDSLKPAFVPVDKTT